MDVCIFITVKVQLSNLANVANSYVTKSNTNTELIMQLRELQHRESSIQNTVVYDNHNKHDWTKINYEHMEERKKHMDYTF